MNISMPRLKYGHNPCAIYKFTFDTGHFYIGSSEHLKTRFTIWRTNLKRGANIKNKVIEDLLPEVNEVVFELIREVPVEQRLVLETEYINEFKDSPLLLNRQLNAVDNSDRLPLPSHIKRKPYPKKPSKPKIVKGKFKPDEDYVWAFAKPVWQFSMDGVLIKKHNSIEAAARCMSVDASTIIKHFKATKSYRGVKGFIFRSENNFGDIVRRKAIRHSSLIKVNGTKPIIDLNTGVFYNSSKELSELIGMPYKRLRARLTGETRNTTPYRYA